MDELSHGKNTAMCQPTNPPEARHDEPISGAQNASSPTRGDTSPSPGIVQGAASLSPGEPIDFEKQLRATGRRRAADGSFRSTRPRPTPDRAGYLRGLEVDYPFATQGTRADAADVWSVREPLRLRVEALQFPSPALLAELGKWSSRLARARKACSLEDVERRPANWDALRRQEAHAEMIRKLGGSK